MEATELQSFSKLRPIAPLATFDSKQTAGKIIEGKIQERYGTAKDHVRTDVDTWLNSLD